MTKPSADAPDSPPFAFEEMIQHSTPSRWHMLVACILLNQSRRTRAWDATLYEVFRRWNSPESLERSGPDLEEVLRPHGFCNIKAKRLRGMSRDYQTWDRVDARSLYGCGQYAHDAYRIFCLGERPSPEEVGDKELKKMLSRGESAAQRSPRECFTG